MDSSWTERNKILQEVMDSCQRQQWSTAVRLLTSLPGLTSSAVLLCNRALCYSKLELYQDVVEDCDKALMLNPCASLAYIYKGQALAAMGKREESVKVWRKGYEFGMRQPTDLEPLLQLQALASDSKFCNKEALSRAVGAVLSRTVSQREVIHGTPEVSKVAERVTDGISKKYYHVKSPSVDVRLAKGIAEVNSGNYEKAVRIFTQLIGENLALTPALIGRGTAYALQRKLDLAITDFTKAIDLDPSASEAWKRRGQARAALASNHEAVADLSEALKVDGNSAEILNERGVVYYKLKDYLSAIDDLRKSVALDSSNKHAYNYLGLASTAVGDYVGGLRAHYKAIELDPSFKEAWTHLAQSYKELADSEKAVRCLRKLLNIDPKCLGVWRMVAEGLRSHLEVGSSFHLRYIHAYKLLGILLLNLGDHRGALQELTACFGDDHSNKDCFYLRGSCFHAIGNYEEAVSVIQEEVNDYQVVIDGDLQTGESPIIQYLAFYQREIALYTASRIRMPFQYFDLDADLEPIFKEAWCKRLSPTVLYPSYTRQSELRDLDHSECLSPNIDRTNAKKRKNLVDIADTLGHRIQYYCPGFLRNVRQHRMAGLAAIDIAQKVASYLRVLRETTKIQKISIKERAERTGEVSKETISVNRGGVCCSSSTSTSPCSCDHSCGQGQELNWRDVYSTAVKWRQASEPCDPVVWIDRLSEKEFSAGFGSHTPMLLGQSKVVRYYPNFYRAFSIAKKTILEQRSVRNAVNRPIDISDPMQLLSIDSAADCGDLYEVIGEDFWVVTPCYSLANPGKVLEGTRLTMQKVELNGFDFAIRTPETPERWAHYNKEMNAAWEEYCNAYSDRSDTPNSKEMKRMEESILRLSFFWYNFMPLARGTAAVGYITLLGLFLAADMEVSASIPDGVQVDWEAILSPDLKSFKENVQPWLGPSLVLNKSWQTLPCVSETFPSLGSVIRVLSSYT